MRLQYDPGLLEIRWQTEKLVLRRRTSGYEARVTGGKTKDLYGTSRTYIPKTLVISETNLLRDGVQRGPNVEE